MKKLKQHHHFILNLKKEVEVDNSRVYFLTISRMIKLSELSIEEKQQCRDQLRVCLLKNRKFIKDLRLAKKPMMIHEKLMADKWKLHAASLEKIRAYVRGDAPPSEEEDEDENEEVTEKTNE